VSVPRSAGPDSSVVADVEQWLDTGHHAQLDGRHDEAAPWYMRVLEHEPANFDALQLLGLARISAGRLDEGVDLLRRALAVRANDAAVHNNLGNALRALGRREEAIDALRWAVRLEPANPTMWLNLAHAELDGGNHAGCIATLEALLRMQPRFAQGHASLGLALRAAGRPAEALRALERALALEPRLADAHLHRGLALADLGDAAAACQALVVATDLAPAGSQQSVALFCAYAGLEVAEWSRWPRSPLRAPPAGGPAATALDPIRAMHFPTTDADLRAITQRFAEHEGVPTTRAAPLMPRTHAARPRDSIRIAYLSPDFGDHPVCRLVTPVLRRHDRTQFSVLAYGWGSGRGSPHRADLAGTVDQFVDVDGLSDSELAERLRSDGIDIAIDLAGYTAAARPRVFALRVAPVQVGWLGYPGTHATGALDYLVADAISIPPAAAHAFSEQVVRLKQGFMPYEPQTPIAEQRSRADFGLPPDGCVLACFGQTRKINPPLFDAWMAALRAVPDAILWLAANSPAARDGLHRQAVMRGVAPGRIVVTPRVPSQAEYLARYATADLVLDTYPYGSHSTALDALWAGAPLLALAGTTMASRVSAAIVTAAGLNELVSDSLHDYETRIAQLARDGASRSQLRERVRRARLEAPLFNVDRLVADLERAYATMHERALDGLAPAAFDIE